MFTSSVKRETGVTIVLIAYNNREKFNLRLTREVLPTIFAHPGWKFQIVVVDNSDAGNDQSCDILKAHNLAYNYIRPETNLMYGPAMNLALQSSINLYVVYICSNHGRMYDPTWIDDLVHPLMDNEKVAMTGAHHRSCHPVFMNFPSHLPQIHIQGGIFGARTEILKSYPYTNDHRWVHWGSDVYQSFQLLNAGFDLYNVPTVKSVWRQTVHSPEKWKYVHDYSEE